MRSGEEPSRNGRKGTMKVAWLLLSLSFLFCGVSSDVVAASSGAPATSGGSKNGTEPTVQNRTESGAVPVGGGAATPAAPPPPTTAASGAGTTARNGNAGTRVAAQTPPQQPITTNPSPSKIGIPSTPPSVANPAVTLSTPKAPVPVTTVAMAVTVAKSAATAAATTTGAPAAPAAPAAPTAPAAPAAPATTAVGLRSTAKGQTLGSVAPNKTAWTKPSVVPTGKPNPPEASNVPTVSTDATGGRQATTHLAVMTTATKGETTTSARNERTTAQPSQRPWTPGTRPTPASAESLAPESRGAQTSPRTPVADSTAANTAANTAPQPNIFQYSLNSKHEGVEDKELVEVCKRLMANLQDGNCTLIWSHKNGKVQFDCAEINGKVKTSLTTQYFEEVSKKPPDNKTLIAILASCGALLIMIFILAICASHHRRPYNENQQHLTEELHTVENGYHDNPTLEVMEVQPEMQEKKVALNGEFNDSWIVPIDNLLKEDIADEEDTHL